MDRREKRLVVNVSGRPATVEIGTLHTERPDRITLQPGETVEIEAAYANPVASPLGKDRAPRPSVVDMQTGGAVVSIDDKRAAAFKANLEKAAADKAAAEKPAKGARAS